jgi:hypothetical protein
VRWYDRKRFYRLYPDVLAYVSHTVQDYETQQAARAHAPPAPGNRRAAKTARVGRRPQNRTCRARDDPDACGMNLRVEPGLTPIGAGRRRRQS